MSKSFLEQKLFGTTFSPRDLKTRAAQHGRGRSDDFASSSIGDWVAALDAMDKLGEDFNFLRIGAYWDDIEPERGQYRWDELDNLIDAIEVKDKYGILLTVGMKAPRYPEFYIPNWVLPQKPRRGAEVSKNSQLRERTREFVKAVVMRYQGKDVIKAWQVENEPMDRAGPRQWFIGADFVEEETQVVRSLDSRPVIINCWCDRKGITRVHLFEGDYSIHHAIRIGDILGLDIYPRVGMIEAFYERRTIHLPQEFKERAERAGKKTWITESQAEPWGRRSYDQGAIQWLVDRHIEQGFQCVLLWGLEWWWEMSCLFEHIRWEARRFRHGT